MRPTRARGTGNAADALTKTQGTRNSTNAPPQPTAVGHSNEQIDSLSSPGSATRDTTATAIYSGQGNSASNSATQEAASSDTSSSSGYSSWHEAVNRAEALSYITSQARAKLAMFAKTASAQRAKTKRDTASRWHDTACHLAVQPRHHE